MSSRAIEPNEQMEKSVSSTGFGFLFWASSVLLLFRFLEVGKVRIACLARMSRL